MELYVAAMLLLLMLMPRKKRITPEPRVVYVQPTPPVSTPDPEVYELVASGIPDDYIGDYVATKRQSWLRRNKYKVGAALGSGALGLAYWQRYIRKRQLGKRPAAMGKNWDADFRKLGGRHPFEDEEDTNTDFGEVFLGN